MTLPSTGRPAGDRDWWRQAVVYQVYPRSFADSNGDGVGDLRGVLEHVEHIAGLGVDAVWLSPFYPSRLADGGYDVDDHRAVAPLLGDLDDFDALVAALHHHGIRLIVDIVPNHSSDQHPWFLEALASPPGSPARARYHFFDGEGAGGSTPPTDWPSAFGGPAWTQVDDGQWFLHLFTSSQPDLNWDNPEVREDFLTTLRFWADRGVDGFRVDVAFFLAKDMSQPLPSAAQAGTRPVGQHPFFDRDEVHEIYAEWRSVFDAYDPPLMAVAEAWVPADRRVRYASPEGLGQAFNFDLLTAAWHPDPFRSIISENLALSARSGSSATWVLSNHDVVRHTTRYAIQPGPGEAVEPMDFTLGANLDRAADEPRGRARARAATMLLLALPGSTYLYQGEELGLFEVIDIPPEHRQDPAAGRTGGRGRDGCRVPLPWSAEGPSFGFSAVASHLPQPAWFADLAVERQEQDPASSLHLYRAAIRLRRELQGPEVLAWVPSAPEVLHFARPGGWHSMTNFGPDPVARPEGEVLLRSDPGDDGVVPADTTIWFRA